MDDWGGDTWLQAKTTNERQGGLPSAYFKQTNKRLAGKPVIFRWIPLHLHDWLVAVSPETDEKFGWLLCHSSHGEIYRDEEGWVPKRSVTVFDQ